TARIAFRMASAVGMGGLLVMGYWLRLWLGITPQDNASDGSALGHQILLAGMGNQADGRIGELCPDRPEAVSGISDPWVEGPVGEEDQKEIVCGVNPDLGAGEASMAI